MSLLATPRLAPPRTPVVPAVAPTTAPPKLRLRSYIGYGAGDAANNLAFSMSSMFLLIYYTDVVGISVKPGLVSGQELGVRLSRPDDWSRDYWTSFERFRRLDRVHIVHGELTGVDLAARVVKVRHDDNSESALEYDTLVISTGVTNGFWRRPTMQSEAEVAAELRCAHDRLADAESVIESRNRWPGTCGPVEV